jgi:5-bromo-4-chloroindolyl phosphate hydrolysis protein
MRVTIENINSKIDRINKIFSNKNEIYHLDQAYGGYRLVKKDEDGYLEVSYRMNKKEINIYLLGFLKGATNG